MPSDMVKKGEVRGAGVCAVIYKSTIEKEYAVVPNKNWGAAYYSDDADDAVNTAERMCGIYPVEEVTAVQ